MNDLDGNQGMPHHRYRFGAPLPEDGALSYHAFDSVLGKECYVHVVRMDGDTSSRFELLQLLKRARARGVEMEIHTDSAEIWVRTEPTLQFGGLRSWLEQILFSRLPLAEVSSQLSVPVPTPKASVNPTVPPSAPLQQKIQAFLTSEDEKRKRAKPAGVPFEEGESIGATRMDGRLRQPVVVNPVKSGPGEYTRIVKKDLPQTAPVRRQEVLDPIRVTPPPSPIEQQSLAKTGPDAEALRGERDNWRYTAILLAVLLAGSGICNIVLLSNR